MARICELYSVTKSFNKDFWLASFNLRKESEKEKKVSIKENILLMDEDYIQSSAYFKPVLKMKKATPLD